MTTTDPNAFGVTLTGFRRKTLDDVLTELQADELSEVADDLDVSSESVMGQLNGIFARQIGVVWEAMEQCYSGFDADVAEGRMLEMLAKLTGTFRIGSTPSEVFLVTDLDIGTTLRAGVHFAAVEDLPDVRWTPAADITATVAGPVTTKWLSEILGPVQGFAGTINVIATPVSGWNSVVNPGDATLGKEIDPDPTLRLRREKELATLGAATVRAIASKVARAYSAQLDNLYVQDNDTDAFIDTLPPHSVEVLIFDGDTPTIDDNALAQTIYEAKSAGIQAFGNVTTAFATAIVNGVEAQKQIGFSRAEKLLVWLEVDLTIGAGYPGDEEVKKVIAPAANIRFAPGRDVTESPLRSYPFSLPGVEKVTGLRMGLAEHPTGNADIPVTFRQVARFDTARIKINSALPSQSPAPAITSISPFHGPATGGTTVLVNGMNFDADAVVRFGTAVAIGSVWVNAGQLSVQTPALVSGVYDVSVTNTNGKSFTLAGSFTVD
jgi:hypothetical protein